MSGSDATGGWIAYQYNPSMPAAVIFAAFFMIGTFLHTFRMIQTRTWFLIPLVIGGYFEAVGYIGRAMSASQTPDWTLGPYIMQSTLLLVAPALFAASIYMELGRIISLVKAEKLAIIRVNWMTKIFVAGDVLRAGIMVNGSPTMGQNLIVGGLFVQIAFFGFFVVSALVFQIRIASRPTDEARNDLIPWRKHMFALYSSSVLILIRSVFRVVEYLEGSDGYLLQHEVFIYLFDGLLMLSVLVIFVVIHPSEVKRLLGRAGASTLKGVEMSMSV
ncbi:RTA1-domain-containing protein [Aspergillus sclerotioniger CBS 115572]|uniref:RTA1-domain-containing protein n=1 Tax=Aspergillus sclerotioniger CBS 115572 TaxID=1450535 RepID=A0A317VUT2_9EURO|nr:RTA1-domain-containing protein [Aspergillus sclerotioniger CBS 115572]PWY78126.1 RTA1-domain-containing protein [Aspergillus sclerotioniger CBS 115572]